MNRSDADMLVDIAVKNLPRMLIGERNLFGWEVSAYDPVPKYEIHKSLRYSIMSLLGVARARDAGWNIGLDLARIHGELLKHLAHMSIGDLGLLLWLDNRLKTGHAPEISASIRGRLSSLHVNQIIGMELAWLIVGLTVHAHMNKGAGNDVADSLVHHLLTKRSAPSGLFYHVGTGARRRFPNFATQIYSIHALSIRARLFGDKACGKRAIRAAECLSQLQNSNGGWPWLYDAERGIVVEPFEIYSVHQDAMAPMAFNELFWATGCNMADSVRRGLSWLTKENELHMNMLDAHNGFVYRSIRRKKPLNRLYAYSRAIRSAVGADMGGAVVPQHLEVNPTDRPYHLGWVLEAWCGGNT